MEHDHPEAEHLDGEAECATGDMACVIKKSKTGHMEDKSPITIDEASAMEKDIREIESSGEQTENNIDILGSKYKPSLQN